MGTETERRVDEKGRVTLPKAIRDRLGIEAGDYVVVDVEAGQVVVRPDPVVSRETFVETMRGCITDETRASGAPDIDPLELDRDWTADLPE